MKRFLACMILVAWVAACAPTPDINSSGDSGSSVPNFRHIAIIIFENKGFETVVGNPLMPKFNELAQESTLLTEYYAIQHPSLPNYLALIGGDTFGVRTDCIDCFIDAPSLAQLIEENGRTWRAYQEGMPEACFVGDQGQYVQRHNPFIYFDEVRLNQGRCEQSVVPLTELKKDIEANSLPNFLFITPNLCNDSHDCTLDVADAWLASFTATLTPALDETGEPYLVIVVFDEAERPQGLRKLLESGGGRVPVILYSPLAKKGFEDSTSYNHYSLLKTISESWGLSYLGHAADRDNTLITAPWK